MSRSLRPVRSFIAMLRRPQLRSAIARVMLESGGAVDAGLMQNVVKSGFVERVDGAFRVSDRYLDDAVSALEEHLGPLSVLRGDLISVGDLNRDDVDASVAAVACRVLGEGERITEAALNERLRMFVVDFAFFRRHAVDTGVVERESDGSFYWLAETPKQPRPCTRNAPHPGNSCG